MSSFALLLFGFLAIVPLSMQYNPNMFACDKWSMRRMWYLDTAAFEGRWYVSQITKGIPDAVSYLGLTTFTYDFLHIPASRDRYGYHNVDFFEIDVQIATDDSCLMTQHDICELYAGRYSCAYALVDLDPPLVESSGRYVYWSDGNVLSTDYASTAVMLVELVINGYSTMAWSELQILVRDPEAAPNMDVVNRALAGFCGCEFVDYYSPLYSQFLNNNTACYGK